MNSVIKKALIFGHIDQYLPRKLAGKIVFTNGCFDVLHIGHLHCLEASRGLGDHLIVGLNSDASVAKLKGSQRPVNTWRDRALILSQMRCVDAIILFDEETPLDLIKVLKPDVITKGGDYLKSEMIGRTFVESYGGQVIILPYLQGYSTSAILKSTGCDSNNSKKEQ